MNLPRNISNSTDKIDKVLSSLRSKKAFYNPLEGKCYRDESWPSPPIYDSFKFDFSFLNQEEPKKPSKPLSPPQDPPCPSDLPEPYPEPPGPDTEPKRPQPCPPIVV